MSLGNGADDCQAQAGTLLFTRLALPAAIEFFEQMRLVNGRNSNSRIFNFKLYSIADDFQRNAYLSIIWRVLDGIFHQVVHCLFEQGRVGFDERHRVFGKLQGEI